MPPVAPPARGITSSRPWAYLTLSRPANVVTAWADILAGFAAAGAVAAGAVPGFDTLAWLLLATTGLYAGGVVLNDVFDAELDARERPERPIPSGRASRRGGSLLGGVLLTAGVAAAWQASAVSGALAAAIAIAALSYDGITKHHAWLGPLNMGLCRGANLLLGVSAVPAALTGLWFLALIPIAYIGAITAISRGEVHGGDRRVGMAAVALAGAVLAGLVALCALPGYFAVAALPFIAFLAWRILPPFVRAARDPQPALIRGAVRAGVLSLIVLDAAIAGGFGGLIYGAAVLLLLPLSMALGRVFAVT